MENLKNIENFLKNIFKKELVWLWFFALTAGFVLIALQNKNKLPLGKGDFVFLAILALLVALCKPRWIFFLFISFIPFENIILASGFLPIQLRPYQFLGGVLTVAVAILYASKKMRFKILKPVWLDWLVFSLTPLSFFALFSAPAKNISLKNNIILLSFVVSYCLVRNFVRNRNDLAKTSFFFLGSFVVAATYGFWQVFADKFNLKSFEVMFGRPNSTFTEPDWLGIFLCFSLAIFLTLIFYFVQDKKKLFISKKYILLFLDILVFLNITLIVLTLSRSAWIGAATIIFFYLIANLPKKGKEGFSLGKFPREFTIISSVVLISLFAIHFGKLSRFDLIDRARSTATSEQKITIACENGSNAPRIIANASELASYNCKHINLEEIDTYKSQKKFVTEIFRKDPNVMTRGQIYKKSWEIIRRHPIFGVGFGTITQNLGTDERGAGLNESNLFLQIWAGSGILGLFAFLAVVGYLFIYAFRRISPICPMNRFFGCPTTKDDFEKVLNIFAVLGISALMVPNLFNAGLLMGIFWLGLAVFISLQNIRSNSL